MTPSPKTSAATGWPPVSRHSAAERPGPLRPPNVAPGASPSSGSPPNGEGEAQAPGAGAGEVSAPAPGRTWVLEFEPGMEILPSNTRLSRYPKARVVRALREQGWGAAKRPGCRGSSAPTSTSPTCRRRGGRRTGTRSPRPGGRGDALALTGKALIDGITVGGDLRQ